MILAGETMNPGEGRMVLHHLLRGELAGTVEHEGRDLRTFYEEQRERFSAFAAEVLAGRVTATNGKPFASVVQIGIGGSDLGPRALFLALAGHEYQYAGRKRRGPMLETRFISNVDPDDAVARSPDSTRRRRSSCSSPRAGRRRRRSRTRPSR